MFWLGIQHESIGWVIMGWQGYSQNAGILVVLVLSYFFYSYIFCRLWGWVVGGVTERWYWVKVITYMLICKLLCNPCAIQSPVRWKALISYPFPYLTSWCLRHSVWPTQLAEILSRHWVLNKMAVILKTTFSKCISMNEISRGVQLAIN